MVSGMGDVVDNPGGDGVSEMKSENDGPDLEASNLSQSPSLEGDGDLVDSTEVSIVDDIGRLDEYEVGTTLECQLCRRIITKSGSSIGRLAAAILGSFGRPPFHHTRPEKGRRN